MCGNIIFSSSPSSAKRQRKAELAKPLKMTSNDEIHSNNYNTQQVFSYFLNIIIAYIKGSGEFFTYLTS